MEVTGPSLLPAAPVLGLRALPIIAWHPALGFSESCPVDDATVEGDGNTKIPRDTHAALSIKSRFIDLQGIAKHPSLCEYVDIIPVRSGMLLTF